MIANVPRATMVIANPTHYAVALRYVREENDAPIVIAKGRTLIALKIREIAETNGIPFSKIRPLRAPCLRKSRSIVSSRQYFTRPSQSSFIGFMRRRPRTNG
jgi:flagellar biosynthesis protein FlhB